jgi:hypothetical protein
MEARYFLSRMPAAWAHRKAFFPGAISGIAVLGMWFAIGPVSAWWHTLLAIWIILMMRLAGREIGAALPLAFFWMALAWIAPGAAGLVLVYAHPLVALCFLYRLIARKMPQALNFFRLILGALPVLACAVMMTANRSASLNSTTTINLSSLPAVPSLIALHVFLELLHYGVWIGALPVLGLASSPWRFTSIPLVRHRAGWPRAVRTVLLAGAIAVAFLGVGFAINYDAARRLYFSVAIFHVLAEVPMLCWLQ